MYHHLLVYTVTLLGVFTTRWRKKPGCFLDVFFSFCDICRTVLQTPGSWVTKYIIIFIYSPHPFFERGWGWEIFHLVLHQFHMWGFQMKPNLALPVQKLFKLWQSSGNKFPLSQICIFFYYFYILCSRLETLDGDCSLIFVMPPYLKDWLVKAECRLASVNCNDANKAASRHRAPKSGFNKSR